MRKMRKIRKKQIIKFNNITCRQKKNTYIDDRKVNYE